MRHNYRSIAKIGGHANTLRCATIAAVGPGRRFHRGIGNRAPWTEGHRVYLDSLGCGRCGEHPGYCRQRRQAGPGAGHGGGIARHRIRFHRRAAETGTGGGPGADLRHPDHRAAGERGVLRAKGAASESDGWQEHESLLSGQAGWHSDRARVLGHRQAGCGEDPII